MRNYELIKEIYEICQTADYRDEVGQRHFGELVQNLIEKERPELKSNNEYRSNRLLTESG